MVSPTKHINTLWQNAQFLNVIAGYMCSCWLPLFQVYCRMVL